MSQEVFNEIQGRGDALETQGVFSEKYLFTKGFRHLLVLTETWFSPTAVQSLFIFLIFMPLRVQRQGEVLLDSHSALLVHSFSNLIKDSYSHEAQAI